MAVKRKDAVQGLLSLFDRPRYLEIGVNRGETFHDVIAHEKVAVDPKFLFDVDRARTTVQGATYHEVTSDEYFGSIVRPEERFDVIYLDGLHTSEQTLRDFMSAILFLREDGVILIDDVRPPTYVASLPNRKNFFKVRQFLGSDKKSWMGDVYRLVYFIETFAQQFAYRIIADNHGQAVIWRKPRKIVPHRTISDVGCKTFEDMVIEEDTFPRMPFGEIVALIKQDRQ
ncbi:class I SAM-dependent methyltransferase [Luteimonas salinilitoris]|uniref:Class I SAM-dependent methyltransferase n=1 Tax=Luteimonas salinilitoris TaxID=3237697 RepID=A0ABV4HUX0_9GAMM